mmetsp:Transcript_14135/g.29734  ORF Transcript_14135/g.29734 Transcript_14135/m.29734 type:complete len:89 (-) Transcript_14135:23-289(-)
MRHKNLLTPRPWLNSLYNIIDYDIMRGDGKGSCEELRKELCRCPSLDLLIFFVTMGSVDSRYFQRCQPLPLTQKVWFVVAEITHDILF